LLFGLWQDCQEVRRYLSGFPAIIKGGRAVAEHFYEFTKMFWRYFHYYYISVKVDRQLLRYFHHYDIVVISDIEALLLLFYL